MSESTSTTTSAFTLPWFAFFFVIKWFGSALAAWSWWWFLMPWVPMVWLICKKAGLL